MIDILLISSGPDRSHHIEQLLEGCGVAHRVRSVHGSVRHLRTHAASIKSADLLIVDDVGLEPQDMASIEEAVSHVPQLNCMLVTPAPSTALLMAAMRAGVRHVLPWPLDAQAFAAELSHVWGKKTAGARREGRVVALTSCKGGTGTSFIAMNLAHALATQRGKRVLLVDANQQFADASLLMSDQTPAATLADLCAQIDRLDNAFFDSCVMHVNDNLDVLAGAGDPIRAGELRPAQLERVLTLARSQYDAVIVDLGLGINPLAIHVLDQSDRICMLVRQSVLYLRTGRRMLDIFHELGYATGKVSVLVNQYDKHAPVNLQAFEQSFGMGVAHRFARDDKHAGAALDQGLPIMSIAKGSALAQDIVAFAHTLWPAPQKEKKSGLARLFAQKPRDVPQLKTNH